MPVGVLCIITLQPLQYLVGSVYSTIMAYIQPQDHFTGAIFTVKIEYASIFVTTFCQKF